MRVRTASWYETRIKYQKTMEDGQEKVVNELYVVDALSCTEAETSIIEEMSCYISGDSAVTSAKKTNYGEIFFSDLDDDDKWYKAKCQFITIDEKSEKEKRSNVTYLVQAKSLDRALRYIDEMMGKSMLDYDIVGLNETHVFDVFEHHAPSSENKENQNEQNQRNHRIYAAWRSCCRGPSERGSFLSDGTRHKESQSSGGQSCLPGLYRGYRKKAR